MVAVMARRSPKNPLTFLHSREKPYEVEWEAVAPRPGEPAPREVTVRVEEPLTVLRKVTEVEL